MKNKLHYKPVGRFASTTVLSPLLLAAALMGTKPIEAHPEAAGYSFKPIAFLGGPAPGRGHLHERLRAQRHQQSRRIGIHRGPD